MGGLGMFLFPKLVGGGVLEPELGVGVGWLL